MRPGWGRRRTGVRGAPRLLESSARHSFDPDTELDWD
ncbi:diiron oxygenase, partial [Streptomyces sp. Act-28]